MGVNALYLCVSMIGCVLILIDFRIGVVLLILLMPISRSYIFPHAMFGMTGLNPLNLLLVGTLGSYLLHALYDGSLRRFVPPPLLWLYVVPIVVAGALGVRHVDEIAAGFYMYGLLEFDDAAGYVRDLVVKPLFLVLFALLVGAAVARSEKPEKFLAPTLISIWVMGAMVIVFVFRSGIGIDQLASAARANSCHRSACTPTNWDACTRSLTRCCSSPGPKRRTQALGCFCWRRWDWWSVALVLTFSRGAFLGFVLVNLLFVLWRLNAKTLIVFIRSWRWARYSFSRARSTNACRTDLVAVSDAISAGRIDSIWLPLLPEAMRHPIFGNGPRLDPVVRR